MNRVVPRVVVILVALAHLGCTPVRTAGDRAPTPGAPAPSIGSVVKPNDHAFATPTSGQRVGRALTAVSASAIEGTDDETSKARAFDAADLERVEPPQRDSPKTTLGIGAVIVSALVLPPASNPSNR